MSEIIQTNFIINLSDLGILQVTGKKAAEFLQGQLTCDITEVNKRQNRLGAHCDPKGRIQATFRLFFYQNDFYFLLPRSMLTHLEQCLQKYAVFSGVNLSDSTQNWKIIGLTGPQCVRLLNQHRLLPEQNNGITSFLNSVCLAISDLRFILLTPAEEPIAWLGHDNELYSPQLGQPRRNCEANQNNAAKYSTTKRLSLNDWHLLDIMAGIATIYPQTIAQFTPHQLNYPAIGGVSFNKGCYIGQEIIARTQYLGKSKSRLYRVTFKAKKNFPSGTSVQNDENNRQGTVIMSAHEKNETYQALACLQNQSISHTIYLKDSQGPILQPLELPYVVQE